ncbi:MAG: hypothetical protein IT350_19420 [Deltaproteobacteria bacterium]|nr:hypothetical protein [Deltaproteobacteria bacterium]
MRRGFVYLIAAVVALVLLSIWLGDDSSPPLPPPPSPRFHPDVAPERVSSAIAIPDERANSPAPQEPPPRATPARQWAKSESCSQEFYAPDGALLGTRYDAACDGSWDFCTNYVYDGVGNLIRVESDHGCDGDIEECTRSTFDAWGNETRTLVDHGCDNDREETPDCMTHEVNDEGLPIATTVDIGCDGVPDVCTRLTYGDNAQVVAQTTDKGCDGTDDSCMNKSYDAEGRLTRTTTDDACDGAPDMCVNDEFGKDGSSTSTIFKGACGDESAKVHTMTEGAPDAEGVVRSSNEYPAPVGEPSGKH